MLDTFGKVRINLAMFFYVILRMDTPVLAGLQSFRFISSVEDTGCSQGDLPGGTSDKEEWRERE